MCWILALALASPAFRHFWQIWPNLAPAKFLVEFPDLADFSTAAVDADCLQLKAME